MSRYTGWIPSWLPQMPFTDNHQLDLDWILAKMRDVLDGLGEMVGYKESAEEAASAAAESATEAAGAAGSAQDSAAAAAGTASDIEASMNQIAVNTSRIDNLVANAGDTDNNAELLDVRVAFDGTIYPTAGDAVRGQASELNIDIEDVGVTFKNFPYDPRVLNVSMLAAFENKTISVSDGVTETATNKYISSAYFSCDTTYQLYLAVKTGYKYCLLCYNASQEYIGRYGGTFYETGNVFDFSTNNTYKNTDYIRMIITKADNTNLTPAEASTVKYYNGELPSEWKEYVDGVKYPYNLITEEEAGYIDDPSGAVVFGTNGEKTSSFIPCEEGENFIFQAWVTIPSGSGAWFCAAFYNENKAFISRAGRATIKETVDGVSRYYSTFTAPANAKYVRFSYRGYFNGKAMATRTLYVLDYVTPVKEQLLFPPKFSEFIKGIAHRGGYYGPENTLPAFKTANAQYGFTYVETDVCMTSDNIPVLLHDDTIDRTSDGTGAINSMTYEQALQYDFGSWKGAQFTGTKIPTLEQLLILCRNLKLKPYLELKQSAHLTDEQIKIIVDLVLKWDMQYETSFIAFVPRYIKTVLKYLPYARVGQLMNGDSYSANYHKHFADLDNGVCNMFFDINSTLYNDATKLEMLASFGYPIEVWTINNADTMKELPDIISGVTSDDVNFETVIKERDTTL